jgi:hypothetical protein
VVTNQQTEQVNMLTVRGDINSPYSFYEWRKVNSTTTPDQEYVLYKNYLTLWYNEKKKTVTDSRTQLRLNYIALLQQLQLFFPTTEAEKWFQEIDFNNENELLLSIPYFAKKLKDISLYYLKVRENVQKSKIKYNLVGTNQGLEKHLREIILNAFTKKVGNSATISSEIWNSVPELSSIKDSLSIEIEELYDDQIYKDQDPVLPTSTYFDLTASQNIEYFNNKNIPLSANTWIFESGNIPVSDTTLFDNINLANKLIQYYIGEDKFSATTLGTTLSTNVEIYNQPIQSGNNFFYWPVGTSLPDIENSQKYKDVLINEAGLKEVATAGVTIEQADTIFLKTKNIYEGAWLRFKQYDEKQDTLVAYFEGNQKTSFRFPFPGYGLSADDISWTGPSTKYTGEFNYLDKDNKVSVLQEYWTSNLSLTTAEPISLNKTNLYSTGAYASLTYNSADKIRLFESAPTFDSNLFAGSINEAWLYKFTKTDIPISRENANLIIWPYGRFTSEDGYPSYLPDDLNTICRPIPLTSILIPQGTFSNTFEAADIIYKLPSFFSSIEDAIECAWLSGSSYNDALSSYQIQGTKQNGLNLLCEPSTYTIFKWEGTDNTDIKNVFITLQHQPDCPYGRSEVATYLESDRCNCRAVLYTPFGHPGSTYDTYNLLGDFVAEINNPFLETSFDLKDWKDEYNTSYTTSSAFAWYQTSNKPQWGNNGQWVVSNSGKKIQFNLRNNRYYIYYRGNTPSQQLPNYILHHSYNNDVKTTWIKAKKSNNTWISTDALSDLILYPGDVLVYQKASGVTYTTLSTTLTQPPTRENRGNIWVDYDYVSLVPDAFNTFPRITVSYPSVAYTNPDVQNIQDSYQQFPSVNLNQLYFQTPSTSNLTPQSIVWGLIDPTGRLQNFYGSTSFSFFPSITGEYKILFGAITGTDVSSRVDLISTTNGIEVTSLTNITPVTGIYLFTNIPPITAIFDTAATITSSTFISPAPGFILNTNLYGWNYNTGTLDSNTNFPGARPFWAIGFTDKNVITNYKGIDSWGTPFRLVDSHNIVTQPLISDIILESNNTIEYDRKYFTAFTWNQPITYRVEVKEKQWCTLNFETTGTSNLAQILNNLTNQLVTDATTTPSNIKFTNFINNDPVQIYYNAITPFVWSITAEPEIFKQELINPEIFKKYESVSPWKNLTNRNYPTVALFPALNELYTKEDKGGFFIPNNLGISLFVNQNFTANLNLTSSSLTGTFEDINFRIEGRGLTKTDQPTPYKDVEVNNSWLKVPITAGPAAGLIKQDVNKKYQKFIPYQSSYETNIVYHTGLITPTSRQDPWDGSKDDIWGDTLNKPESFTGVINVDAWAEKQILKQFNKQLDAWCTDIYGNQYGLYKVLNESGIYDRKNIVGEIWTRKNSQSTGPAATTLKNVFDTYQNSYLINELTGIGVKHIDVFFDTLMVETTGVVLFEKIQYDYTTDNLFSITDNARYISLAIPVSTQLVRELTNTLDLNAVFAKCGETWFNPKEKQVFISVCGLQDYILIPELYKLDLNTLNLTKQFPLNDYDLLTINELSSLSSTNIERPILSFDNNNEFTLTVKTQNSNNILNIVELSINTIKQPYTLNDVTVYSALTSSPFTPQLPYINHTTLFTLSTNNAFSYQLTAQNTPEQFLLIDAPSWVTVSNSGLITGLTPDIADVYYGTLLISNSDGTAYQSLTINVTSI